MSDELAPSIHVLKIPKYQIIQFDKQEKFEADYLVIGAGATSLAFVDEIITSTKNIKIIVVERRGKPGGHWNDAYPFATLQNPEAWYGVSSKILGSGSQELASKAKIIAYYEDVAKSLSSTGRVKFFWKCEYQKDGKILSLTEIDQEYQINVNRKIVDGTHNEEYVPSTNRPAFPVDEAVNIIPIRGLSDLTFPWKKYVIIGCGKTGIDAILYLLGLDVDPDRITWIVSNDCWYYNKNVYNIEDLWDGMERRYFPILEARDINDVYKKYEEEGFMLRINKDIWPTKNRSGSISFQELQTIRRVKNVIREGRIIGIEAKFVKFKKRDLFMEMKETLFVDCISRSRKEVSHGLEGSPFPIFDGKVINLHLILQMPNLSAAALAALEICFPNCDKTKNDLCTPHFNPEHPTDWFRNVYIALKNSDRIYSILGEDWCKTRRVSILSHMKQDDIEKLKNFRKSNTEKYYEKLREFSEQRKIYDDYQKIISKRTEA